MIKLVFYEPFKLLLSKCGMIRSWFRSFLYV